MDAGDRNRLHKALLSAFPSKSRLAMMLGQRFGVLYGTLTQDDAQGVEYWNIIVQVGAEGWLDELARASQETVPGNDLLTKVVLDLGLSSAARASLPSPAGANGGTALQRLVRDRSEFTDLPAFLARLTALEGQACRIEQAGKQTGDPPQAFGTGFLVGPDLVMTNQHVTAALDPGRTTICRFDYLTDARGIEVRAGVEIGLAADWQVASRPPDPSDDTPDDIDKPAPENLDFALIRLARRVGDLPRRGDPGPDNPARGWIAIDPARDAAKDEDLFILQHPEGAPLKLAVGRLIALHGDGLRWRHDAATEGGSSGSPVFNRKLELVGLHHAGDPNYFRNATFNQAIPMAKIIGWLDGKLDPFWTEAPP